MICLTRGLFFPLQWGMLAMKCCGCLQQCRGGTTMADRVGQHFGNYRLVALLGEGSYAQVYLGQHVRLSLQAAIKVLHTHMTEQEVEHFQQEAETIAGLAHPSMVRLLDYDVQDGVPFLVMEHASGGSLRTLHPN